MARKAASQDVAFRSPGRGGEAAGSTPPRPLQGDGCARALVRPAFSASVGTGKWCEGRGLRQCWGVSTRFECEDSVGRCEELRAVVRKALGSGKADDGDMAAFMYVREGES